MQRVSSPAEKDYRNITSFVMVFLVIMGIVLVLKETVMDPFGLYWSLVTFYKWLVKTTKS